MRRFIFFLAGLSRFATLAVALMLACLAPQAEALLTPSDPVLSAPIPSQAHAPESILVIEEIHPVGYADDGECLDLCICVEPETLTRVFCIVKSPTGLDVYAVYRKLRIPGVGLMWHTGRLTGHVYLAFDSKGMGAEWDAALKKYSYSKAANYDPQNSRQYVDWITHSFHPWNVKTGDRTGQLVSVIYTEGSYVDINSFDADIRPIVKGDAILLPVTSDEVEQIRLFELSEKSALANNKSMCAGDHGTYSFVKKNCADGAKRLVQGAGLKWPKAAYLWNGGVGVEGPMDWTFIPQTSLLLAQGGYHSVKEGKAVVWTCADTVATAGRAIVNESFEATKVVVDHCEGVEFIIIDDSSGAGGLGLKFSF